MMSTLVLVYSILHVFNLSMCPTTSCLDSLLVNVSHAVMYTIFILTITCKLAFEYFSSFVHTLSPFPF